MPGPIKPSEVVSAKVAALPEEVFAAFNDAIARAWDGSRAVVKQAEVCEAIMRALDLAAPQVYERHLLDVEEAYRAAGWTVDYDKPAYNESYPATFTFSKRRMRAGEIGDEDG